MYFTHTFTAPVAIYDYGKYFYTVVYVPAAITDELPTDTYPRLRVDAEIDDVPLEGTLMPDRIGSAQTQHLVDLLGPQGQRVWYLMAPKKLLQTIDKRIGDEVEVRLRVADQNAVTIPEALADYLAQHAEIEAAWSRLTPGKQRGYAHRIASAKTRPTIERRLSQLAEDLLGD